MIQLYVHYDNTKLEVPTQSKQNEACQQSPEDAVINQPLCHCALCQKGWFLQSCGCRIQMTELCLLILKSLMQLKPEKQFYSMKDDINDFVSNHWCYVCNFPIFQKKRWKKMLLDTFNHCKAIDNGKEFGMRASFRIKNYKKDDSLSSEMQVPSNEYVFANEVSIEKPNEMKQINQEMTESFTELINELTKSSQLLKALEIVDLKNVGLYECFSSSQQRHCHKFEKFIKTLDSN